MLRNHCGEAEPSCRITEEQIPMTAIQEELWQKMLVVEFNARFWRKKAYWLGLRLKLIQLAAALLSGAAVNSFFSDPSFSLVNKIVGLITALLALSLSVFDLKGILSRVEDTQERFAAIYPKLEELWHKTQLAELPEEDIAAGLAEVTSKIAEIKEPHVAESRRLREQSFNEICTARGLV